MATFPCPPASEYDHAVNSCSIRPPQAMRGDTVVSRDVLAALTYGLEMARCGAMLVGDGCQVHVANRAALAVLQKNDGISISRTGLIAERAADTLHLQRMVQQAINYPDVGEPAQSPFILERKLPTSVLLVRVAPGPELECWQSTGKRSALVKVYDPDPDLMVDEKSLISVYGLTRGEANLALKLVQGKSIEAAANELCISAHTARTHLKRIFMKTDTHRQSELVLRILAMAL